MGRKSKVISYRRVRVEERHVSMTMKIPAYHKSGKSKNLNTEQSNFQYGVNQLTWENHRLILLIGLFTALPSCAH